MGLKAGQLINHFPNRLDGFKDFNPEIDDELFATGTLKAMQQIWARSLIHGHVCGDENMGHHLMIEGRNGQPHEHYDGVKVGCGCYYVTEL